MVEPLTALTAGVIANLAFQKFLETGATKAAEKLAEGVVAKMDDLRKLIWLSLLRWKRGQRGISNCGVGFLPMSVSRMLAGFWAGWAVVWRISPAR